MSEQLLSFVKKRKVTTQNELEIQSSKLKMPKSKTTSFLDKFLESKSIEKKSKVVVTKPLLLKPDLIFDSSDPLLKSHPMAPEVYYELKHVQKFPDILIPSYLRSTTSLYDKLIKLEDIKGPKSRIALSLAMFLNCRGQHMCPVNLGKYVKALPVGYYAKVSEIAEKVGEKFRYSPDELKDNALKMLGTELGLGGPEFEQTFSKLYEIDKRERKTSVTRQHIGGLAYLTSKMVGIKTFQKEIGQVLQTSEVSIRDNYKGVADLFGIKINTRGFPEPSRLEYSGFPSNQWDLPKYWEEQAKKSFKSAELLFELDEKMASMVYPELSSKEWGYDKLEDALIAGGMYSIAKRYIPERPSSTDFKKIQQFARNAIKR